MIDKVSRNPLEPLVRRDDLVVLAQELIEKSLLVRIEFGFLDLFDRHLRRRRPLRACSPESKLPTQGEFTAPGVQVR